MSDLPPVTAALLLLLPLAALSARRAEGATSCREGKLTVDSEFPGGNGFIDKIEGDRVTVRQDLRDTAGHWFWWHFRVRGAGARTLRFLFTKGNVIGVRGPAVSTDRGKTWRWLGKGSISGVGFSHAFATDADDVRFCFAMPYFEADLQSFLKRFDGNAHLRVATLTTSKKGRKIERLHVGRLKGKPDHRVLVTCRHHCCECMASYALEGLVESALADTDDGRWLRERVELLAVPFMDKDGVEDGDQGKNRKPHDHNRDYGDKNVHPSVKALRQLVPTWCDGRLHAALDLHCPHIRGKHNEVIYMVGSAYKPIWQEQTAFGKILETVAAGPLPYRSADSLPFGKGWNTHKNYGGKKSFARWAAELPGVRLATTFEIPYANASGKAVTADSARAFGGDLARALRRYLDR